MEREKTYDITQVCEKCNVSSRTLRYYEDEGLIESIREGLGKRRRYDDEQIKKLRMILALRTIGLSIKQIKEYAQGEASLYDVVHLRRSEIQASITAKYHEIISLNRILDLIEGGRDIFNENDSEKESLDPVRKQIVKLCSEAIIKNDFETLYSFFSKKMKDYMPLESFKIIWKDTVIGVGNFEKIGNTFSDKEYETVVFQDLIYEKITVRLKYVFIETTIHGLWMDYVEKGQG